AAGRRLCVYLQPEGLDGWAWYSGIEDHQDLAVGSCWATLLGKERWHDHDATPQRGPRGPARPRPGAAGLRPGTGACASGGKPGTGLPGPAVFTYAARAFPARVYWGDTHLHTSY